MRLMIFFFACIFHLAAIHAQTGTLIILNKSDHNATLIDLGSGASVATIPTGTAPHEVAVSPDGRYAVVTNYGAATPGNSLTVIDLSNKIKLKDIDLGDYKRPHGIEWLKDGNHVAVTVEMNKAIILVHVFNGSVAASISTDQDISHMLALTPDNKRAFVANIRSGSVSVLDLVQKKLIKNIPTGAGAEGVDVTPNGKEVWVTNRAANTVTVLNTSTLEEIAVIESKDFPIRAKVTPNGKHVLVSNARSGDIAVFDAATKKEVQRIKVELSTVNEIDQRLFGNQFGASPVPIGILILPDGSRAYVANSNADLVTVIDLKTWKIVDRIKTGEEPDGLGYSPLVLQ